MSASERLRAQLLAERPQREGTRETAAVVNILSSPEFKAAQAARNQLAPSDASTLPSLDGVAQEADDKRKVANEAAVHRAVITAGTVAINQHGVPQLLTRGGGCAIRLESDTARDILQARIAEATGKTVGKETLNRLIEQARGNARLEGRRVETAVRVAKRGNDYYLDRGNGCAVKISAGTVEEIENNGVVAFVDGACELPSPQTPATTVEAFEILCGWLERRGIAQAVQLIVIVVMIEWLRPNTANPVLELIGGAGSGKTTTARQVINVIDPTPGGKAAEVELEAEHIGAAAQRRYVLLADNQTALHWKAQDVSCKAAYGTILEPRKLYSQTETEPLAVHNPLVITAINPVITRADLLDRAVRVQLKRRASYVSEVDLCAEFEAERPRLLGALLVLMAAALAKLPEVKEQRQWHERLVDFAQIGEAAAQAVGMAAGAFVEGLRDARRETAREIVSGDLLVQAVLPVLENICAGASPADALPGYRTWSKSPGWCAIVRSDGNYFVAIKTSALLQAIEHRAPWEGYRRPDWLPTSARALTSALNLKLPLLADYGIAAEVQNVGGSGHSAWVFGVPAKLVTSKQEQQP